MNNLWLLPSLDDETKRGLGRPGEPKTDSKGDVHRLKIRDLTKLRRRRQRQCQKAIGLGSKTTTSPVHHAFLYVSLPSLHDYNVKWPNFKFFFEDGNGKAINSTIKVWTRTLSPLFNSNINSHLLSMVWKDEESIFQRRFHGRRCCRIVRSLLRRGRRRRMKNFAGTQPLSLGCLEQSVAYWPPANQRHSLSSPFGRRINADSLLKRKHGGFVSIFLTRDSLSPELQGFVYFPFLVNFCVVRQNQSFLFAGETPELLFKMTFKSPFFKTCFRQTLHAHR